MIFIYFQALVDFIGSLGWSHVTAIIDSTWSKAIIRKLLDVAGLRHICIVDVIVVHNNVSSIQNALQRMVDEHARKGGHFIFGGSFRVTLVVDWWFLPKILGLWLGPTKAIYRSVNTDRVIILFAGGGDT